MLITLRLNVGTDSLNKDQLKQLADDVAEHVADSFGYNCTLKDIKYV